MTKLNVILKQVELEEKKKQTNSAWQEHTKIVRGNPVRAYAGMEFKPLSIITVKVTEPLRFFYGAPCGARFNTNRHRQQTIITGFDYQIK